MFFQEELVNIFVFPLIYSHRSASGVRFIKPCQFAAASQRYRFCSWSGLVPPRHRKTSFRILKSLRAAGRRSTAALGTRLLPPAVWLLGTREEEVQVTPHSLSRAGSGLPTSTRPKGDEQASRALHSFAAAEVSPHARESGELVARGGAFYPLQVATRSGNDAVNTAPPSPST